MSVDTPSRESISPHHTPRRLIIRLSSIGDIILASSTLNVLTGADWVVSREFAEILQGHPSIGKVWSFDRRSGLRGWMSLCKTLHAEGYDEVVDLHQTLRSRMARMFFWRENSRLERPGRVARWRVCTKPRLRSWGYFVFKKLWPKAWRPGLMVDRYARFLGVAPGTSRPDLRHLLEGRTWPGQIPEPVGAFYCVMPGSQWKGKRWPVKNFVSLIGLLRVPVIVMGTPKDRESIELSEMLRKKGLPVVDSVGKLSLRECAYVLSRSAGYIGNDTGLGHLAEAVGVPAHMIFGPTVPDQGFGPWRADSTESGSGLWCRPCGKDGSSCFRISGRYLCLQALSPAQVARDMGSAHER